MCSLDLYSEMAKVAYEGCQRWRLKSVYRFNKVSTVLVNPVMDHSNQWL